MNRKIKQLTSTALALGVCLSLTACDDAFYGEEPNLSATCEADWGKNPTSDKHFLTTVYATGDSVSELNHHLREQGANTKKHPCVKLTYNPLNIPNVPDKTPTKVSAPTYAEKTVYVLHFAKNSQGLNIADHKLIARIANRANNTQTDAIVAIRGFGDNPGISDNNNLIAQKRAEAIKNALREHGLNNDLIQIRQTPEENAYDGQATVTFLEQE